MNTNQLFCFVAGVILCFGCDRSSPVFHQLDVNTTGVSFSNTITTNDSFNAIFFEYIYNGGGVASVDLNGDDLVDLFFTGNQVSNRLYLNRGNFSFEDVTEQAGLLSDRWCTGVAIADVNGDGRKDIYVAVAGYQVPKDRMENLLFINKGWNNEGVPSFEEQGQAYGLNDDGYSTQAAFFDYDKDGDLDMYLLTNALEKYNRNTLRAKRINGEANSTDRLYRNNGDQTFSNVSQDAGIQIEGYGLGVKVTDLNLDGYPDVYVANDFLSNDLIWINNRDGTFTNRAAQYLKHQTHNGMGVDVADFNNDQLPDIAVLDMLPPDNYRQKMMIPYLNPDHFWMRRKMGYEDQYMRNTVQLHQGFLPDGSARFSEVGNLLGMAATDWSWSVLFADFDNNGWKDVFITNGYRKDITNLDYINYSNYNQLFGTLDAKKEKAVEDLSQIPDVPLSNYIFKNTGELNFENVSSDWGINQPSFSNGAAYADLDNDGDLDLVVNNIDAPASIYENLIDPKEDRSNYIQINLTENSPAITKYNTIVDVYTAGELQRQEFSPFKGYKSTVSDRLHFGLGTNEKIDSILAIWPDGKVSKLIGVMPNQRITIDHTQAEIRRAHRQINDQAFFKRNEEELGIQFLHDDNDHSDLKSTFTLWQDYSKAGPAIAVADIDADGLEDFFVGGNAYQPGVFYIQHPEKGFIQKTWRVDSVFQDVDALFFDVDKDGDQDLYVQSGGTRWIADSDYYQDRLYLNDGKGNFTKAKNILPPLTTSGACVRAIDFDKDGDTDLFVGGRIIPKQYPNSPRSYLLENKDGRLVDNTPESLQSIGMVTDAAWTDFDGDTWMDLIIVGEWMPVTFFKNQEGQLVKTDHLEQASNGWWMHINAGDIDRDGDTDYLLGNIGLNSKLLASTEQPVRLYASDFDGNGAIDPLLSCYIQGEEFLMHERDLLIDQIPGMKRRFPNYSEYAKADLANTLSQKDMAGATIKESFFFANALLENKGKDGFALVPLPQAAQIAPVMGSIFTDVNSDGQTDILTAGNLHRTESNQLGWFDASYGHVLQQETALNFRVSSAINFNLIADGDVRTLKTLQLNNGNRLLLLGEYGNKLKTYELISTGGEWPLQ